MLFCSFSLLPQVQKPVDDRKKPLMFFINKRYPDIEFIRPYQLIIHDILLRYNQVIKLPFGDINYKYIYRICQTCFGGSWIKS